MTFGPEAAHKISDSYLIRLLPFTLVVVLSHAMVIFSIELVSAPSNMKIYNYLMESVIYELLRALC